MNSFIVCRGTDGAKKSKTLMARLGALGFDFQILHQNPAFTLLVGGLGPRDDATIESLDNGDYIVSAGLFAFGDYYGRRALRRFYEEFDPTHPAVDGTQGTFALAIYKSGALSLLTDELGVYKIYRDREGSVISNLFVAVAEATANPEVDVQGCYEYAWNGGGFGERTFFRNIATVPCADTALLKDNLIFLPRKRRDYREHEPTDGTLNGYLDLHIERCRSLFRHYASWFGGDINLSLSGGYDSRLLLALLLDVGVQPHVFTYGHDDDEDCRIAKSIAASEGLDCERIDKDRSDKIPVGQYKDLLIRNYAYFDGWKNGGLFDNSADFTDRAARVRGGRVKMNGGGGEIYRNFFYLHDGSYFPREIVWSFYSRYAPAACTDLFDSAAYEMAVANTICKAIGSDGGRLSRQTVELIYPLFRNRYWTARVQSENHAFGPCLLPFLEPTLVQGSCDIPIKFKSYGRFEGAMIRRLNPRLAALPSAYGFSFAAPPPASYIFKAQLTYCRPTWLRRYSYRLQHRRHQEFPYFLDKPYLQSVMDASFPYMSKLFRIEAIHDPEVLNRVATMEFVCQRMDANIVPC